MLPERAHFSRFQHAQQLELAVGGEAQQLVKKESAAMRLLHQSRVRFRRPGKRSAAVAEQQAFDHLARQGAAVDINELPPAATEAVDMLSEQLFPGTAGADQQDGKPRGRVALDHRKRPLHRPGRADDGGDVRPGPLQPQGLGHCFSPFGSRGTVTLSASASVFKIRGVKNR